MDINFIYLFAKLFNSFTVSIVFLGVVSGVIPILVNLLLKRPITWSVELESIIAPQRDAINATKELPKDEKHLRLENLYKKYSYHPLVNILRLIPFLIQVPLLFFAFKILNDTTYPDATVYVKSFDLNKPDQLLNGKYNLLPLLLFIIMLMLTYFQKNLTKSGIMAGLLLSLIFFLFSYSQISAVLVFWIASLSTYCLYQFFDKAVSEKRKFELNYLKSFD